MNTEAIVYLLRKTNLALKEIGKLTPIQFVAIVKEVQGQESREEYNKKYRTASLLAAIYNTIPRKRGSKVFTPKDFLLGREQTTSGEAKSHIEKLAHDKDIIMPKYTQHKE